MSLRVSDMVEGASGSIYEVTSTIASGGFGATFFVTEKNSGSEFVAKSPTQIDKTRMDSLRIEYSVLKDLESHGVTGVMRAVDLIEFDSPNGKFPVLVLERARGITLQDACMKQGISYDDTSDIIQKIAETMAEVHSSGYMHLDIAPDNIFIDDLGGSNEITIIDFGIAARKSDTSTFAVDQHGMNKPFFGAPEQREVPPQASQRSDIFSLGCVGFCLVLGYEKTVHDIAGNQGKPPPYDLEKHTPPGTIPSTDAHLNDVIKKATWPSKDGRFCTMQEMCDAILGKEPDTNYHRIVADNKVYPLKGDGPWKIGREQFQHKPDIVVKDKAITHKYLSREQAYIERRKDGVLLLHHTGKNETRVKVGQGSNTRWNIVKEGGPGYPLGSRYQEICFGYCDVPPSGAFDEHGNPMVPGPYKTIEFQPPGDPSSTIVTTG